jgi:hypothetical protein
MISTQLRNSRYELLGEFKSFCVVSQPTYMIDSAAAIRQCAVRRPRERFLILRQKLLTEKRVLWMSVRNRWQQQFDLIENAKPELGRVLLTNTWATGSVVKQYRQPEFIRAQTRPESVQARYERLCNVAGGRTLAQNTITKGAYLSVSRTAWWHVLVQSLRLKTDQTIVFCTPTSDITILMEYVTSFNDIQISRTI